MCWSSAWGRRCRKKWVAEHIDAQHARLVLTVGALFDFVSGTVPRAPALMRALRFEWMYRLLQEPSRLWRRYMLGVPHFLYQVIRHQFGRKQRSAFYVPPSHSPRTTLLQLPSRDKLAG